MKALLLTHTDLDGISPIILLNLTKIKFQYKTMEIRDIEETFDRLFKSDLKNTYDVIYICDLTIPQCIYDEMDKLELNYKVFDHHEAHLYANNKDNVTINLEYNGIKTCATEIFYKYLINIYPELNKPIIKDYVKQVRELDTFTFTSDTPRDLDIIREAFGKLEFIKSMVRRLKSKKDTFTLTDFEKRFTKLKKAEILKYMESKENDLYKYLINDKICGIVFSENNKSELGNYLANRHPELDLIILIDASSRISYRCIKENVNVNEFASLYSGGGHKKASGSPFTDNDRKKIIENYFQNAKELVDEN